MTDGQALWLYVGGSYLGALGLWVAACEIGRRRTRRWVERIRAGLHRDISEYLERQARAR